MGSGAKDRERQAAADAAAGFVKEDGRAHYESDDVVRSEAGLGSTFSEIVESRLSRRGLLKGAASAAVGATLVGKFGKLGHAAGSIAVSEPGLAFTPISLSAEDRMIVPEGYKAEVLVRWGDPILGEFPEFKPGVADAKAQEQQFGYNCDYVGFMPLPHGSRNSDRGLLAVNNEYANPELMFPDLERDELTEEHVKTIEASVGMSIVEIARENGRWEVVLDSPHNRRIHAYTEMRFSGPAAGSEAIKAPGFSDDGVQTLGTLANCAAGTTPWGTVLTCEENFQDYFANGGEIEDERLRRSYARYGIPNTTSDYGLDHLDHRFQCPTTPNGPYHFGWVVEVDPYDPDSVPIKRSALGRFRHEAATTHITKNNVLVMYSGDDARFEYVYKFVSAGSYRPSNTPEQNSRLLDEGTLYVARFDEDGSGEWMPLVFGQGPLTPENGFRNQGDVVADVRLASDLLGATKMDRPEDIETNPVTEAVYIVCTNNTRRGIGEHPEPDAANPRPENRHGHIIELIEKDNDHSSTEFHWELFLVCGDPEDPSTFYAGYDKSEVSPISCPDNIVFDRYGNLWIATDGLPKTMPGNDGLFAVPVEGPNRGKLRQFFSSVPGAEVCGPEFTPDNTTLFVAIQHPGEGGTFEEPATRWPDGEGPPRPSVVAIQALDGRPIGEADGMARRDLFGGLGRLLGD